MRKILVINTILILLSGCGSIKQIPLDYTDLKEEKATVYFYTPSDIPLDIYLDGNSIGEVKQEKFIKEYIEPGKHIIHADHPDWAALLTTGIVIRREKELNFAAEKIYKIQSIFKAGTWTSSTFVTDETGDDKKYFEAFVYD